MIFDILHPEYQNSLQNWSKWRLTYEGGEAFKNTYLRQLSAREDLSDFADRKSVTYSPSFAKAGINEVKDSIYQRMRDISRTGGSRSYQDAIDGRSGGVDLEGSSMNYFMGCEVLPELLVMQKCGIYVDMPPLQGESLAINQNIRPYIYKYNVEDIRNWICDEGQTSNEFVSVLLEESVQTFDNRTGFPTGVRSRLRHVWKDVNGQVWACFYLDEEAGPCMVDVNNQPIQEPIPLKINKIPFTIASISESLMTDVADYQIALLNLASTDMSYALRSNFPFYTEQYDARADSSHLKPAGDTGEQEVKVGVSKGRRYPKGMERPDFINPSSEPLKISMEKQAQLKSEIRELLKLTISNLRGPKMASAESKKEDNRSLETGLSYIGLELENVERRIAEFWAMYENDSAIATVNYPEEYSLESEEERRAEVKDLTDTMFTVPSPTYQKQIAKRISRLQLGREISRETLETIDKEIDSATTMTSDPDVVRTDVEAGLVGLETASKIRGYPDGEVEKAKKDHADRLARIAAAQSDPSNNPGARGNTAADSNPGQSAKDEKAASRDTAKKDTTADNTRGKGK